MHFTVESAQILVINMSGEHQKSKGIRPTSGLFYSVYTSWIVLFFGLVLTAAAWYVTDQSVRAKIQQQFDNRTSEISSAIYARMIGYEQVLWGGIGFFHASENIDRKKFHSYVSSLNIEKNWPGIQGIGFSIPVTAGDKAKHIGDIRNEGFPEYTIKPEADREEYSAIIYLEPFDWRNKRAFGYDMWSNDMRREAMARARDTGEASTSGIITLVQETDSDVQKGFLTYLPLYQDGVSLETIEQRRRAFIGWVYSPFRMGDLMAGILGSKQTEIEYEIFDGDNISKETMLFDSNKIFHNETPPVADGLMKTVVLELQGRKWTLHFTTGRDAQGVSESRQPMIVAIAGLVVSFLLFFIVSSLAIRQKYAEELAQKMTRQLAVTNKELTFQKSALDEHAIVSIADVKGIITYANDKFSEISGYSREELIGQNHHILKSDEHSEEFWKDLWVTIANGKTWNGEIKNIKKGGGYYWVDATIVPTLDDRGKPTQYVAIRTDVTAQKDTENEMCRLAENAEEGRVQMEEQATQMEILAEEQTTLKDKATASEKSKSEFLAAMSHEIRTPMVGVIGMSNLLLETNLTPQQLDWATSIKTSGANLMEILNEILDQSKLDAGKLELSPTDFHLASLFNDTTHLFDSKIDEKGLTLEVELDDTLPEDAHADRMRIGQVLSNFLSNALKFTESGRIVVRVGHEPLDDGDFTLRIEVTDSGIGLSKQAQRKLFTAFTQADSSTSRTYGGTGLGLSISKQLTEMMGGEIGVSSAEGIGSTFWFTVLCQPAKEKVEASDKRRARDRWMSSRPLKVLVAEDNVVNRQVILTIFRKLGHEVTVADNGKVASEFVEAEDFDLVLMDIRMPVMDGLDATKLIRAMNNDKSKIPIIGLTADIAAGNIVEYTDIGMNDVCAKPLDLPVLLKAINTQLGEEIHTSITNALSAEPEEEKTNIEDDVEPKDDSTFAQVLERVGAMVDQASSQGSENTEPPSEMAISLGDKFAELMTSYEKDLTEQCNNLKEAVSELAKKPTDHDHREKVKTIAHTIKGGGGTFGYNLITTIATQADDLISEDDILDEDDLVNLRNYSDALKLVAHKKMSGNGGKAGRILLQRLPAKASG